MLEIETKLLTSFYLQIFTNVVKLRLLTLIRIHLVVNISWVVRYRKQIERQKIEKVIKYLVWWKRFMTENNM